MNESDLPLRELAAEHRADTRGYRRNLLLALAAIVALGAFFLIPYVELQREERALAAREAAVASTLERVERSRRGLDRALELLAGYQETLKTRSRELAEAAKRRVARLNDALAMLADPELAGLPGAGPVEAPEQMTAQMAQVDAPAPSPQRIAGDLASELRGTYGLAQAELDALVRPDEAAREEWQRVADQVLNRIMAEARQELRNHAREQAERLATAWSELEATIDLDLLDVSGLAEAILVPDDSLPNVTATPRTTRGKDAVMDAELAHVSLPSAELQSRLQVRAGSIAGITESLASRKTALTAEITELRSAKEALETSMAETASRLQSFFLPAGFLDWNADRLTRWFPLLASLILWHLARTGARLDRQRVTLRQRLAGLDARDRDLVTGAWTLRSSAWAFVGCAAFVVYLQYVVGGAEAWGMLLAVVAGCAAALLALQRRPADREV